MVAEKDYTDLFFVCLITDELDSWVSRASMCSQ